MSTREICEFCNVSVKDKHTLKNHIIRNKTCLKLRGLTLDTKFICKGCENTFSSNINLIVHIESCKQYITLKIREECKEEYKEEYEKQINELQQQLKDKNKIIIEKENTILIIQKHNDKALSEIQKNADKALVDAHQQIETLQKMLENLASKAIDKPNYDNNLSNYTKIEEIESETKTNMINHDPIDPIEIKEYKLGTTNFIVPIRSDGILLYVKLVINYLDII